MFLGSTWDEWGMAALFICTYLAGRFHLPIQRTLTRLIDRAAGYRD